MDARRLTASDLRAQFDAVYAASFLEHLCEPDIAKTLAGFAYVLRGDGFVDLRLPDSLALMRYMVEHDLDLDAVLYTSPVGPIRACVVLWGYQTVLASGRDFFAHRFGFSPETICNLLAAAGFQLLPGTHPIIPVMLHDASTASALASALDRDGIFVTAFSYPVVAKGAARIRTQMSAAHTREQLDRAIDAFGKVGRAFGLIG
jgi:hypothetical protein